MLYAHRRVLASRKWNSRGALVAIAISADAPVVQQYFVKLWFMDVGLPLWG